MDEMKGRFPGKKVSFLVCSDEPRSLEEFPGLSVGFGPGSPLGDMYALAKCDYIIGAISSFSQWASFYGNKPLFQLRDSNVRLELGKFRVRSWMIFRGSASALDAALGAAELDSRTKQHRYVNVVLQIVGGGADVFVGEGFQLGPFLGRQFARDSCRRTQHQ